MIRSILVPLDGSTFGEHALPLAASLAQKAGAALHLVHVHQLTPPATVAGVALMDTVDLHLRQDEQAYLADIKRRLHESGPSVQSETALIAGDIAPALHEYADKVKADIVVMSTHGRGAVGRFWLGSVADDMVRELPRPVLLIRPHEGKPDLKRRPELKNILLPLDGTELAEKIAEPAVELGQLFEATYTLVRVIRPALRPSYLPDGTTMPGLLTSGVMEESRHLQQQLLQIQGQQQAEAQHYLNEAATRLFRNKGGVRLRTRVSVNEEPAVGILEEAQAQHADLIAMETHARSGLTRLVLGSVADKIVRGTVVPVLLNRT